MSIATKIFLYGGFLPLLFVVSLQNYLLFHSLAELFSIVIAFGIFVIGWNSRKYYKNNYLLFIGISYLFVAFFDTLHTLAYKGMNIFNGYDDNNLPPQLWLVARYIESIALLLAPTFFSKPVRHWRIISVLTVISALAIYAIFFAGLFPVCFVTGAGLTPFKVGSEYLINLILCAALYMLYRNKAHFEPGVLRLLTLSIACTMVTELCFTVYVHLYGISNLVGHFFKILSFWFMYKAIIETALGKPYDLLFRELSISEERFASAFHYAPIGIALVAPNGGWLKVNRAACAIVGYTEEELLSITFQDITHPDDLEADLDQVRQMLDSTITSYQMEKRYFHKNGSTIWALLSVSLVRDEDGNPLHFVSQIIDITDRKTVEAVQTFLSERGWIASDEEFFPTLARFLSELLSLEFICIDRLTGDGHMARTVAVYHNGRFEDNVEYALKDTPCGDVVGKTICCFPRNVADLFPNDPVLQELNAQSYAGTTLWGKGEKPIGLIALIGEKPFANQALVKTVLHYVAPRAAGEMERLLADEALRESEARFRSYYELGLIGMAITSLEKGWVQYNDCLCAMLGYSREELAEKNWAEMTHPDDLAADEAQFLRVLQREIDGYTMDKRFIHKDGRIVQTALSVKCLRNQDGTPKHFVAMIQDITVRKTIEESLIKEKAFLRAVIDSATDLIYFKDCNSVYIGCNKASEAFTGLSEEAQLGKTDFDFFDREMAEKIVQIDRKILESGVAAHIEEWVVSHDDSRVLLDTVKASINGPGGNPLGLVGISRDITERQRKENYRKMGRDILLELNEKHNLKEAIQRVIGLVKITAGVDAVGIRLQDNEDFPYFCQDGFSLDFLQKENSLLVRNSEGGICRDEDGNVCLECTCGMVLTGKTDHSDKLFTSGGSVWTNNSYPALQIPLNEDPRTNPRNECIHQGFASVALIPIKAKGSIVGLLQLNAHRAGCFTLDEIEILEDIAENIGEAMLRKQAEEKLIASERFLRLMTDQLPGMVGYWTSELRCTFANKAYVEWFDKTQEEVLGITIQELMGDDLFRKNESFIRKALQGEAQHFERTLVKPTGEKGHTWAQYIPDLVEGKVRGFFVLVSDVTKLKQAEEKIRETNDYLENLINYANVPIIVWDMQFKITRFNCAFEELTGRSADEVKGESIEILFPPPKAADSMALIKETLIGERWKDIEINIQHKNGLIRTVLWNSATILAPEGDKPIAVIAQGYDITEQKRVEGEKVKLEAQLLQAQKMEAIGTLAGGIAHDFNNILGAIIGNTEIACDYVSPKSDIANYLNKVMEASFRAANLVKQILVFSRQAITEDVVFQPGIIIKEVLEILRPSLPSTISIIQQIDSTKTILADPTHIHQVVMNLCTNAFHAMEEAGGTLEIILKDRVLSDEDLFDQAGVQPGNFVVLSIADCGLGIPLEIRQKMFDPYFTTKGIGKGTGMGLAIVHGIIKKYGGFVNCESTLGKGTIFHVFFPAIDEKVADSIKPVEEIYTGKERILFIDDEEILVDVGKVILEHLGYMVTVCTSSLEALSTFQNQSDQFDVVITDQTMPGMTGVDLAKRMLQIRPDIPIILCTGYSNLINEAQAKSYGIKGFAMKPMTKKDIARLLRNILDESKVPFKSV